MASTLDNSPESQQQIEQTYAAAVRLLARRDHTAQELTRKLLQKQHHASAVEQAIGRLVESNYINDRRFADAYVHHRVEKGYGPNAIRRSLSQRGVDSGQIDQAMRGVLLAWSELACNVIRQRFIEDDIVRTDEQAEGRIARFLFQRGFSGSDSLQGLRMARKQISNPDR